MASYKTGIFIATAMRTSNNTNEITIIDNADSIEFDFYYLCQNK